MDYIFVKLQTDAGIEGIGESTVEWNEKAVVSALEELGEFLIGKDPFATDYDLPDAPQFVLALPAWCCAAR